MSSDLVKTVKFFNFQIPLAVLMIVLATKHKGDSMWERDYLKVSSVQTRELLKYRGSSLSIFIQRGRKHWKI